MNWQDIQTSSSNLEWAEREQNARAIATAFDTPPRIIGDVRAIAAMNLINELRSIGLANDHQWLCSIPTTNRIRYVLHLAKMPLPSRKLRKCHMRRISAYRKQARRRYGV